MHVRGDSPDKNAFWRVICQVAIDKFKKQGVYYVRLALVWFICFLIKIDRIVIGSEKRGDFAVKLIFHYEQLLIGVLLGFVHNSKC